MAHIDILPGEHPPRRHGALTLVQRATDGAVLLVLTSYKGRLWQLPGGALHKNEAPHDGQMRELGEETGLTQIPAGDLLLVDGTPPTERSVEGLNLVFFGGTVPADTVIHLPGILPGQNEPELLNYAWVPRARLRDYCKEHQARRIEAALNVLDARGPGPHPPQYLYSGHPVLQPEAGER